MKLDNKTLLSIRLLKLEVQEPRLSRGSKSWMEFHVSRHSRQKYDFEDSIFQSNGNVILANFHAARIFAQKINNKRDVISFPEKAVRAGQINAMGLIDEVLHYVFFLFKEQEKSDVLEEAQKWLERKIGKKKLKDTLLKFVEDFPPVEVYRGKMHEANYLNLQSEGVPHSQIILEELILLWLANVNPAFSPFLEFFNDENLEKLTSYQNVINELHLFFEDQPKFGSENQNLIDMLRSPALAHPHSLIGQLEYMRKKWGFLLGKYFYRLLRSLDLIKEEEKQRMLGSGQASVYEFVGFDLEIERFSPDKDWMPRVVLIAKSTYVWLDQLSKKYSRSITQLDQIPDEELDLIANWGFTGLWLIGLWERSAASKRIKQLCGNPEAVASAYSLFDYEIAHELGGEEAFNNLRHRAWQRGIRMAGDMVPNHMGIDSRWVVEHPDWFISLDYSPYPAHTFNGPNLSWDNRVGIFLEDHYFSRSDAAVIFKRVDFHTGDTKYIYHGNDGTSMPWNDTAQLNYLNPEVREAVIQTIINVARKFPVIRFDAAMTLTKKHYHRLWYPEPGSGGDIPTRSEHGLSTAQFHEAMTEEFWREVVERVAQEIPDTLLLAEAFWLMEGYFVRTLGMHRVYNSAFMNMLKNEHNAQYRASIKNVLEFNPEILKRFVNFMNNPDEETAVAQFGKGDKYFGVCMMLVTMPGLPMFGHGQIEGFTEKYGMEYRRAYWDEQIDQDLVRRHEHDIFPVMCKRYLFAEVQNFYLYDFYMATGEVNENVFAYSNSYHNEHGLVVYNNKFENTKGWIRHSAAFSVKKHGSDERILTQKTLGEALKLPNEGKYYLIFRENISGLEFIRHCKSLHEEGLFMSLNAYQYQVFMDFRIVEENVWNHYYNLASYLDGRGVPSIDEALKETFLRPIHEAFRELVNADMLGRLTTAIFGQKFDKNLSNMIENKMEKLMGEVQKFSSGNGKLQKELKNLSDTFKVVSYLPILDKKVKCPKSRKISSVTKIAKNLQSKNENRYILLVWLVVHRLGAAVNPSAVSEESRAGLDEWLLTKILESTFYELDFNQETVQRFLLLIKILTSHQRWWKNRDIDKKKTYEIMLELLKDSEVQIYLQVNRNRDILWFNKETFQDLLGWLLVIAVIQLLVEGEEDADHLCKAMIERFDIIAQLQKAEKKSEYRVEKLLESLKK